MNIQLVLTIHMDAGKSHNVLLAATYLEEQQQHWSCTMRISQVFWYFLQKSGSEIMCIVSSDRR